MPPASSWNLPLFGASITPMEASTTSTEAPIYVDEKDRSCTTTRPTGLVGSRHYELYGGCYCTVYPTNSRSCAHVRIQQLGVASPSLPLCSTVRLRCTQLTAGRAAHGRKPVGADLGHLFTTSDTLFLMADTPTQQYVDAGILPQVFFSAEENKFRGWGAYY